MKLETKRLILRNPKRKDIKDMLEGLNPLEVSDTFGAVPHPYTRKDAKEWIKDCNKEDKKKKVGAYLFAIELKSEKKLIGGVWLRHIDYFNSGASFGYWVNKKYWRQGIIKEAGKALLDLAFNKLKLRRVYLFAYAHNVASNGVAKKFGFKLEGTLKKSHKSKASKKIYDTKVYGLLKEEWIKVRKRL